MSILTEIEDNSSCYLERINYLKSEWDQDDVKKLQTGVNESLKNIKNGAKSFVVYGEPQSGKTEFMIALVCKLLDEKYETIFIIMNDNTELEYQNGDTKIKVSKVLKATGVGKISDTVVSNNKAVLNESSANFKLPDSKKVCPFSYNDSMSCENKVLKSMINIYIL